MSVAEYTANWSGLKACYERRYHDNVWQGKGVGADLFKDAMRRTMQAADIAGIRAFTVHAKDEAAGAFYQHFDFVPSPTDPLHLYLLVKELRRASGEG